MNKFLAVLFFALFCCCSGSRTVEKHGGMVMELSFGDTDSLTQVRTAASILSRMSVMKVENPVIEVRSGNMLRIELPLTSDTSLYTRLATVTGKFEILEMYEQSELTDALWKINERIKSMDEFTRDVPEQEKEYPLYHWLNKYVDTVSPGSEIGVIQSENVPILKRIFSLSFSDAVLPRGSQIAFARNYDDDLLRVIILKLPFRSNYCPVVNEMIWYAQVRESYNGRYEVSMRLKEPYYRLWEEMTSNNVGRCLSIVIDDEVYSYPRVNSSIEGGHSTIAGNFTHDQAAFIAALLGSEPIETQLMVESVRLVERK